MVTSIFHRKWKYAVSRMRNASGHIYWKISSFIMDVAMGQIPRSTERISSLCSLSFVLFPKFLLTYEMRQYLYGTHYNLL